MKICEDLRRAVLQAAIQGKLTEQKAEDGTAEDLLKEIRKEKAKLIAEEKIKQEKVLSPIKDDEKPFDIPENWMWVRLGEIISLISGCDLTPDKYNSIGKGTVYITGASNIINGVLIINRWTTTPKNIAKRGDILLTCKGTVGANCILEVDKAHIARQIMSIRPLIVISKFIQFFLQNNVHKLKKQAKSMIPGIERKNVIEALFPVPPLAEQHRIVERVDALMSKIDELEKIENELEAMKKKFPGDLRDALLQAAIQGKLTEQKAEDGAAEDLLKEIRKEKARLIADGKIKQEKALPPIKDDEIPFEIPDNWVWVRLGEISTYGQPVSKINAQNIQNDQWILDLEDIEKGGRILQKKLAIEKKSVGDRAIFHEGDILYSKLRPYLLKILLAPSEGFCTPELVPFRCYGKINNMYILHFLKSPQTDHAINQASYGVKMPRVGSNTMLNILVPLPPLAEQHRIVERLNELLPLCEAMRGQEE